MYYGFDIGGTKIEIAVFDEDLGAQRPNVAAVEPGLLAARMTDQVWSTKGRP